MTTTIQNIKQKLSFATKQGIFWRLTRATEPNPKRRDTINLIISLIEDDKTSLRKQLKNASN